MTSEVADGTHRSGGNTEAGNIQEPLSQTRLDEIRRYVSASKSSWADLRQQYLPGKSCFEPLNFTVSSWSAMANEDVTGLGDDLDADEAYSQAATMAAYGVDLLNCALSGPTVDRKLTEDANKLFVTLCATLMDTRYRHRNSVTKAIVEKVDAFRHILDDLDNSPRTEDASSRMESIERDEQMRDPREAPHRDKVEQQNSSTTHQNKQHVSESTTSDRRTLYSQGHSRSPASRRQQQLHDPGVVRSSLATSLLDHSRPDPRLSAQCSAPLSLTPDHLPAGSSAISVSAGGADSRSVVNSRPIAMYQALKPSVGKKSRRRCIIRTALLKHGLTESAIFEYFKRHSQKTNSTFDKLWNRWVEWCEWRGLDATKRSANNLTSKTFQMLKPALNSVWLAIEGNIHSTDLDY